LWTSSSQTRRRPWRAPWPSTGCALEGAAYLTRAWPRVEEPATSVASRQVSRNSGGQQQDEFWAWIWPSAGRSNMPVRGAIAANGGCALEEASSSNARSEKKQWGCAWGEKQRLGATLMLQPVVE
jgi:hypothetical protein